MTADLALALAQALAGLGALLGCVALLGCAALVFAYVHDRVRRLGWLGLVRHLCRPHPVDALARQARHRQPAPHSHFTRHRAL